MTCKLYLNKVKKKVKKLPKTNEKQRYKHGIQKNFQQNHHDLFLHLDKLNIFDIFLSLSTKTAHNFSSSSNVNMNYSDKNSLIKFHAICKMWNKLKFPFTPLGKLVANVLNVALCVSSGTISCILRDRVLSSARFHSNSSL